MARTKPAPTQAATATTEPTEATPNVREIDVASMLLEIPVAAEIQDPVPHFVELQLRSQEAKAGMARLRDGLMAAGVRLCGTNRPVESNADAIRYLLEQIALN